MVKTIKEHNISVYAKRVRKMLAFPNGAQGASELGLYDRVNLVSGVANATTLFLSIG